MIGKPLLFILFVVLVSFFVAATTITEEYKSYIISENKVILFTLDNEDYNLTIGEVRDTTASTTLKGDTILLFFGETGNMVDANRDGIDDLFIVLVKDKLGNSEMFIRKVNYLGLSETGENMYEEIPDFKTEVTEPELTTTLEPTIQTPKSRSPLLYFGMLLVFFAVLGVLLVRPRNKKQDIKENPAEEKIVFKETGMKVKKNRLDDLDELIPKM